MKLIKLAGNVVWFVLAGWSLGLGFLCAGLVCCLTIIGIPLGVASLRLAWFAIFPFGRELVPAEFAGQKKIIGSSLFNGLWFLIFGWWLAFYSLLIGIIYCLTIVFIPLGIGCFKLAGAAIFPLGKRVVSADEAKRIRETIRTQVAAAK